MTSLLLDKNMSPNSKNISENEIKHQELCVRQLSLIVKGNISNKYVVTMDGTYLIYVHEDNEKSSFSLCGKIEPPISFEEISKLIHINEFGKRINKCDTYDSKVLHGLIFDIVAYDQLIGHLNKYNI